MKFRRFLSGVLFGTGCALTFVGLLAVVLPAISNQQMDLVLASFSMTSDNRGVALVNRFMSFVLEQNWRVVVLGVMIAAAGGALLAYFQPRKAKEPAPIQMQTPPSSTPVRETLQEAPNPFAVAAYHTPEAAIRKPVSAFHPYAAPMLERNKIESADAAPAAEAVPYFSPRFEAESRAVQTSISEASQSGSRLLFRPEPAAPEKAPEETPVEVPPAELSRPVPPPAAPAPKSAAEAPNVSTSLLRPSPRIRSTMGRHSASASKMARNP